MATFSLRRLLVAVACLCATAAFCFFSLKRIDAVTGPMGALPYLLWIMAETVAAGASGIGISVGLLSGNWRMGVFVAAALVAAAFLLLLSAG